MMMEDDGAVSIQTFDPTTIPNILTWYDFNDITGLYQDAAGTTPVTASGQPIGKMLDKSGNARHLVRHSSGDQFRPTYIANHVNGKGAGVVDSAQGRSLVKASAWTQANPFTIFIVFKAIATTAQQEASCSAGVFCGPIVTPTAALTFNCGVARVVQNPYTGDPAIACLISAGTPSEGYLNGSTDLVTASLGTNGCGSAGLFSRENATNTHLLEGSWIGEYLSYSGAMSSENRLAVTTYLSEKWGITL